MTPWELIICAVLYVCVALRYAHANDPGMSIAFWAYAVANVGFILKEILK